MAKEKKMSYEDALTQQEAATKKRQAASKAKEDYAKEKGLKPKKDYSEDEKHGKAWKKLQAAYLLAKEEETAAKEISKELKPKNERATKYEYPADVVTTEDRKKWRTKERAKAKAAAKPPKEEGAAKATPSKKKVAAAEEAEAPAATSKKKKKVAPVEAED